MIPLTLFWEKFDARKPKRKKKLSLYKVEHVDNPCYVTLAVNPKEYFEFFQDYSISKKYKGIEKGSLAFTPTELSH